MGVLMLYRAHRIIMNADIKEMFLQFPVAKKDRDFQAFLWHVNPATEPDLFINLQHVFGAKCSPAIANQAVAVAVRCVDLELVEIVKCCLYMDDYYCGSDKASDVVNRFQHLHKAMRVSSLEMGKIQSNSPSVLAHFPDEEKAPSFREIDELSA